MVVGQALNLVEQARDDTQNLARRFKHLDEGVYPVQMGYGGWSDVFMKPVNKGIDSLKKNIAGKIVRDLFQQGGGGLMSEAIGNIPVVGPAMKKTLKSLVRPPMFGFGQQHGGYSVFQGHPIPVQMGYGTFHGHPIPSQMGFGRTGVGGVLRSLERDVVPMLLENATGKPPQRKAVKRKAPTKKGRTPKRRRRRTHDIFD